MHSSISTRNALFSYFYTIFGVKVSTQTASSPEQTPERLYRFQRVLGVSVGVAAIVWTNIVDRLPQNARVCHLIWALYFLKNYSTEITNAAIFNCSEKTFRTWLWPVLEAISGLSTVRFIISTSFFLLDYFKC